MPPVALWHAAVGLWAGLAVLMVGTLFNGLLRALLVHGKVRQAARLPGGWLLRLEIPKRGWTWFYLAGAVYNLGIAAILVLYPSAPRTQRLLHCLQPELLTTAPIVVRVEIVTFIALIGIQDTRRFLESVFITEFGDARMHVALLVAGLIHYLGIAPSLLVDPVAASPGSMNSWKMVPGLMLFAFWSYQQYRLNLLLARQKRANGGRHIIPRGGWFERIRCPLYTTEVLIYMALVLVAPESSLAFVIFAWVLLNQSICAHYANVWYLQKFRDEQLAPWVLFPRLW